MVVVFGSGGVGEPQCGDLRCKEWQCVGVAMCQCGGVRSAM